MGEPLSAETLKITRWGNSLRTPRSVTVGVVWAWAGDEPRGMRHETRRARMAVAKRVVRALKCAAPSIKPPTSVGGSVPSLAVRWRLITQSGLLVGALQFIEVSVEDGFGVGGLEARQ